MATMREIRTRIRTVRNIEKITRAMKLVAAARLNRAQERVMSARPFAERLEQLLGELSYLHKKSVGPSSEVEHPFLAKRHSNRIDLVLVTADRGLCGGFNATLIRFLRGDEGFPRVKDVPRP